MRASSISSLDTVRLIAEIVTEGTGVRVVFGNSWSFDVKKKELMIPKYSAYYSSEIGAILHEVGHSRFSETDTITKTRGEHLLVNGVED